MDRNYIIGLQDELNFIVTQAIKQTFYKLGMHFGEYDQNIINNHSMQYFDTENQTNLDNSIKANTNVLIFKKKENENMQKKLLLKISQMPNCRIRTDGRCEWRKTIAGVMHCICERKPDVFIKRLNSYRKELRGNSNGNKRNETRNYQLTVLINDYYNRYKRSCKSTCYQSTIKKYLSNLTDNIRNYTKGMIVDILNQITAHRMAEHAFILLKNTFKEAMENTIIKNNPIINLKKSDIQSISNAITVKGKWFTPAEQSLIYQNINQTNIGNEIEFFLLVGCRLSEAFNAIPDWGRNRIYLNRTKRDGTSGYVPLSPNYCAKLKANWSTMFQYKSAYYTKQFGKLLTKLKIKRQPQEKPIHRLRHTFATNIYYLGAKDAKIRASLMGHRSTQITDDIYTDFDPEIKKQDIINIYGNLYPTFE